MSDEIFENDDEIIGGEEVEAGGKKKVGFLPGIVIQILKWAAIALGAVIFIVTVVVITMNIMNRGTTTQSRLPEVEAYEGAPEILSWFGNIGEIRTPTADERRHTVMAKILIGYPRDSKRVQSELIDRTPWITELVRSYFSSHTASELLGPQNEQRVQEELKARINNIMTEGKIKEVIFGDTYNIVEF